MRSETAERKGVPSCVIIVENLPVPFDRRVWQEAQALRDAGWTVSVICPISEQYSERYEMLDGIAVYRHPLPFEAHSRFAFLFEYVNALFHEGRLLLKVALTRGFDVIQVCNPPDVLFLNALPYKLFGKRARVRSPRFVSRALCGEVCPHGLFPPAAVQVREAHHGLRRPRDFGERDLSAALRSNAAEKNRTTWSRSTACPSRRACSGPPRTRRCARGHGSCWAMSA